MPIGSESEQILIKPIFRRLIVHDESDVDHVLAHFLALVLRGFLAVLFAILDETHAMIFGINDFKRPIAISILLDLCRDSNVVSSKVCTQRFGVGGDKRNAHETRLGRIRGLHDGYVLLVVYAEAQRVRAGVLDWKAHFIRIEVFARGEIVGAQIDLSNAGDLGPLDLVIARKRSRQH